MKKLKHVGSENKSYIKTKKLKHGGSENEFISKIKCQIKDDVAIYTNFYHTQNVTFSLLGLSTRKQRYCWLVTQNCPIMLNRILIVPTNKWLL